MISLRAGALQDVQLLSSRRTPDTTGRPVCFKPVTKRWRAVFLKGKTQRSESQAKRPRRPIWNFLCSVCTFSGSGQVLGGTEKFPRGEYFHQGTLTATLSLNWKQTTPHGHLGLLLSLNQQPEKEVPELIKLIGFNYQEETGQLPYPGTTACFWAPRGLF